MIAVTELAEDDWPRWRQLRLAALAEAPEAFGSMLADWTGPGDQEQRWRGRLADVALNLVLSVDGLDAGMVSATEPDSTGEIELISMWIAPKARGCGVGDTAVQAVLRWAAAHFPGSAVVLSVKRANAPAARLYRRNGFRLIGPSPDSADEDLMRFESGSAS